MTEKQEPENLKHIIDSFKGHASIANSLALYSSNNAGFAVIFVEEDHFFKLLDFEDNRIVEKTHIDWSDVIHPEDSELLSYPFLSRQEPEHLSLNLRIIREDGAVLIAVAELEKIHFSSTGKTIAFQAKIHDAKSLMSRSMLELEKASSINFSSLLRYSQDFIYFKDLHHSFTASSQTMANITGYASGDEHIGLNDYDVFSKEHADIYYRHEKQILQGTKPSIQQVEPFYDEGGEEGYVDTRKYPLKDENKKIVGLFGISRIVTQELLAKRMLEESQEQLRKAKNEAEKANKIKTDFLSAMSHELRTPMNAIIGFSDMMKNETYGSLGNDKNREYAADINNAGKHLLNLINGVLDLSKIEAGKEDVNAKETDISSVLFQCLEIVQVLADEKRIVLIQKLPNYFPTIKIDRQHLVQIFINLISNAIKFTPPQGRIEVLGTVEQSQAITIKIMDSGVGIAPKDIPKVMESFERGGHVLTRTESGTGLGLPLAKRLVELNGGTIEIQSELEKGTTVTLRFSGS